jgi:hypothetical protein
MGVMLGSRLKQLWFTVIEIPDRKQLFVCILVLGWSKKKRKRKVIWYKTCFYFTLPVNSEIEDGDQILFVSQAESSATGLVQRPLAAAPAPSRKTPNEWLPQNMTSKLFVPKTAEMDEGFLIFDKLKGATSMFLFESFF